VKKKVRTVKASKNNGQPVVDPPNDWGDFMETPPKDSPSMDVSMDHSNSKVGSVISRMCTVKEIGSDQMHIHNDVHPEWDDFMETPSPISNQDLDSPPDIPRHLPPQLSDRMSGVVLFHGESSASSKDTLIVHATADTSVGSSIKSKGDVLDQADSSCVSFQSAQVIVRDKNTHPSPAYTTLLPTKKPNGFTPSNVMDTMPSKKALNNVCIDVEWADPVHQSNTRQVVTEQGADIAKDILLSQLGDTGDAVTRVRDVEQAVHQSALPDTGPMGANTRVLDMEWAVHPSTNPHPVSVVTERARDMDWAMCPSPSQDHRYVLSQRMADPELAVHPRENLVPKSVVAERVLDLEWACHPNQSLDPNNESVVSPSQSPIKSNHGRDNSQTEADNFDDEETISETSTKVDGSNNDQNSINLSYDVDELTVIAETAAVYEADTETSMMSTSTVGHASYLEDQVDSPTCPVRSTVFAANSRARDGFSLLPSAVTSVASDLETSKPKRSVFAANMQSRKDIALCDAPKIMHQANKFQSVKAANRWTRRESEHSSDVSTVTEMTRANKVDSCKEQVDQPMLSAAEYLAPTAGGSCRMYNLPYAIGGINADIDESYSSVDNKSVPNKASQRHCVGLKTTGLSSDEESKILDKTYPPLAKQFYSRNAPLYTLPCAENVQETESDTESDPTIPGTPKDAIVPTQNIGHVDTPNDRVYIEVIESDDSESEPMSEATAEIENELIMDPSTNFLTTDLQLEEITNSVGPSTEIDIDAFGIYFPFECGGGDDADDDDDSDTTLPTIVDAKRNLVLDFLLKFFGVGASVLVPNMVSSDGRKWTINRNNKLYPDEVQRKECIVIRHPVEIAILRKDASSFVDALQNSGYLLLLRKNLQRPGYMFDPEKVNNTPPFSAIIGALRSAKVSYIHIAGAGMRWKLKSKERTAETFFLGIEGLRQAGCDVFICQVDIALTTSNEKGLMPQWKCTRREEAGLLGHGVSCNRRSMWYLQKGIAQLGAVEMIHGAWDTVQESRGIAKVKLYISAAHLIRHFIRLFPTANREPEWTTIRKLKLMLNRALDVCKEMHGIAEKFGFKHRCELEWAAGGVHKQEAESITLSTLIHHLKWFYITAMPAYGIAKVPNNELPLIGMIATRVKTAVAQVLRESHVRDKTHVLDHFCGGKKLWLQAQVGVILSGIGLSGSRLHQWWHRWLRSNPEAYDPDGYVWLQNGAQINGNFDVVGNVTNQGRETIQCGFARIFHPRLGARVDQALIAQDQHAIVQLHARLARRAARWENTLTAMAHNSGIELMQDVPSHQLVVSHPQYEDEVDENAEYDDGNENEHVPSIASLAIPAPVQGVVVQSQLRELEEEPENYEAPTILDHLPEFRSAFWWKMLCQCILIDGKDKSGHMDIDDEVKLALDNSVADEPQVPLWHTNVHRIIKVMRKLKFSFTRTGARDVDTLATQIALRYQLMTDNSHVGWGSAGDQERPNVPVEELEDGSINNDPAWYPQEE
jgi:hypothetical protein